MAKQKQSEAVADSSPSIKNIDKFVQLWDIQRRTGKKGIDEKTMIALRLKLSQIYNSGKIHPKEHGLYTEILRADRAQGNLGHQFEHHLAEIEAAECTEHCEVIDEHLPPVLEWKKGDQGKYRIENVGGKYGFRYHVYTQYIVPSTSMYPMSLAIKLAQGRPVDESEYPKPVMRWRHRSVSEKEFHKWFKIVDVDLFDSDDLPLEQPAGSVQIEL